MSGVAGASVTAVVPTVGRSPLLADCLAALRQDGGAGLRLIVVEQGGGGLELPASLGLERLRAPQALGFARAANLGLAAATTPWVALVNDDAVVRAPWLGPLVEALERHPEAAAAQGVNLDGAEPPRIDGCGLAWNERWQAVQLLHGHPASAAPAADRDVFGVSATAAVYRRAALDQVAVAGQGGAFDPRLDSYYEDVDLACRLRARGLGARLVARAICRHSGSTSSSESDRLALVYRNRYLVLARLLGRAFWPRLPLLVLRDLATLVAAAARGEGASARAITLGLAGVPLRLPGFASFGPALLPRSEWSGSESRPGGHSRPDGVREERAREHDLIEPGARKVGP